MSPFPERNAFAPVDGKGMCGYEREDIDPIINKK